MTQIRTSADSLNSSNRRPRAGPGQRFRGLPQSSDKRHHQHQCYHRPKHLEYEAAMLGDGLVVLKQLGVASLNVFRSARIDRTCQRVTALLLPTLPTQRPSRYVHVCVDTVYYLSLLPHKCCKTRHHVPCRPDLQDAHCLSTKPTQAAPISTTADSTASCSSRRFDAEWYCATSCAE